MKVQTLALVAAGALLTGCLDSPTAVQPTCEQVTLTVAEQRGDTVVTTTGLRYISLATGEGPAVETCRALAMHYRAQLEDGEVFDSSNVGFPIEFVPGLAVPNFGRVIDGLEEGVLGMRSGGRRMLIIPANLAYGATGFPDGQGGHIVPPNATVLFDVEVLAVQQ